MSTARTAVVLFAAAAVSLSQLSVDPPVGSHAVLQRHAVVRVRGAAPAGATVVATPDWPGGEAASATAGADGRYELALKTGGAGGPYAVTFAAAGAPAVVLDDVLLGDVWLCSGQSNMEWSLDQGVAGADAAIRDARFPLLRHFEAPHRTAPAPRRDVDGSWKVCSPDTAAGFTAVGFFFGRALLERMEVPIGLLHSSWGGTPAESWASAEALKPLGDFDGRLARLARLAQRPEASLAERRSAWRAKLDAVDAGVAGGFAKPDCADAEWTTAAVPDTWDGDLGAFDGVVWYRRTVDLPAAWAGKALVLELGPIDDHDDTYVDGVRVGGLSGDDAWMTPRRYVVPAESVRGGRTTIAVRALDTGGAGRFGSKDAAMRIHPEGDPASAVALGGPWRRKVGAALGKVGPYPFGDGLGSGEPSVLYNAMIAPLLGFPIKGAIWYQGESNVGRADQYRKLFPAMIADWRARFAAPELPFYFVQIAPYGYGGDEGAASELREAQEFAWRTVPHAGMVTTTDVGDARDIHPRDKTTVGARLARWALAKTYRFDDVVCEPPRLQDVVRDGAALRAVFEFGAGLRTLDGKPPAHVEIAGADGVWRKADARIVDGALVASSPDVPAPTMIRHAWGAADAGNVANAAGLPLGPCRGTVR